MEDKTINIAVITDDGINISQHFGRAKYYEVMFVEDGKIIKKERREKLNHSSFGDHHHHNHSDEQHGFDEQSQNKHKRMAETIGDCRILLAGGMGEGAYQSMIKAGLKPIITDIKNIDEAAQSYINGTIIDHTEKLH